MAHIKIKNWLCSIELFDEPIESGPENIRTEFPTALYGDGIINPYGPTLTIVCVDGELKEEGRDPIVEFTLNPFTQSIRQLGFFEWAESYIPEKCLQPLFELRKGNSCPTFLLPSHFIGENIEENVATYAKLLMQFPQGRKEFSEVMSYPQDAWKRVTSAADEAVANLAESLESGPTEENLLTADEALEMARHLLTEENLREEMRTFMVAWHGSVEFGPGANLPSMSLKEFMQIFLRLTELCELPE